MQRDPDQTRIDIANGGLADDVGKPVVNAPPRAESMSDPDHSEAVAALDADFHEHYRETAYYSCGRDWADYAPAYHYGLSARLARGKCAFEDAEVQLANGWCAARNMSRLCWAEARGAVRDAWRRIDSARQGAKRVVGE